MAGSQGRGGLGPGVRPGHIYRPPHLPARILKRQAEGATQVSQAPVVGDKPMAEWPTLESLQQEYVQRVIEAVDGNKRRAAQILGIDRRTLYRWLDNYQASERD